MDFTWVDVALGLGVLLAFLAPLAWWRFRDWRLRRRYGTDDD